MADTSERQARTPSVASKETTEMSKFKNEKTGQEVEMSEETFQKLVREGYPVDHLDRI